MAAVVLNGILGTGCAGIPEAVLVRNDGSVSVR